MADRKRSAIGRCAWRSGASPSAGQGRSRSFGNQDRGSFHAGPLSGGPVVRDAASPAITQRPLAANPLHGGGRRSASGLWVWATAAPAGPHGYSDGRAEEHLCGPAPRIGQDVELGGETALVRPISRRRGRRASSQLSGGPSDRSRPASGCSRPVPCRPAPEAFARTRSCGSVDTGLCEA